MIRLYPNGYGYYFVGVVEEALELILRSKVEFQG